jgi:hypothetical protein
VALQVSGLSQTVSELLPQEVPEGSNASAGQEPAPSHISATSHSPASARQVVVVGSLLTWQVPVALQVSGLSQTVSELLPQEVPADSKRSIGQSALEPVHCSAMSQSPASARQVAVEGLKPSAGQAPEPSQFSATSQLPAEPRHSVVLGSLLA